MKRPVARTGFLFAASALALAIYQQGFAQTEAPPAPASPSSSSDAAADEEVVLLSPFNVDASEDKGSYRANSTLAGTRIRTDLNDIPSSISVVTAQFLQDTGSKKQEDLLVYTTNTEVGGVRGNFSGAGGASTYNESSNLLRPSETTRVRGLAAADNTRDYFLTEIPWDGYNVDRVDLQRGPNSILFGVGSPAGIINTSLNGATFKNANKFENRIDRWGSFRNSIDLNYVIIKNELALRFAALDDDTKYQQDPAFNDDRRYYGAVRYEPKFFKIEGARTTIRANYEDGEVRANRPRSLPPIDSITPWFKSSSFRVPGGTTDIPDLNKITLDPNTTWTQWGDNPAYPNRQYPWFREAFLGRLFNPDIAFYHDATSSRPTRIQMPTVGTSFGRNPTGGVDGTIGGIPFARSWGISTFNNYARAAVPGGKYYSNVSLKDPSIYDFYNNLIDGDNKREWQDWKASNVALAQTFFNDRLGFELVYDWQRYEEGQVAFLEGGQYQISVDINTHLLDGTPNSNVGRAYVGNSGQNGNRQNFIDRDNKRFTTFLDLRAEDHMEKGWLSKLIGRHVFTGLLSEDVKRNDSRGFARWASEPAYTDTTGSLGDITSGARQVDWIAYIGGDMRTRPSAAGANLGRVRGIINPSGYANVRYFDSHWNAPTVNFNDPYTYTTYDVNGAPVTNSGTQSDNPANYVGWKNSNFRILNADKGDIESLYTSGQKAENKIKSRGITWQGYLWDGTVVPVFGWRRDEVIDSRTQAPKGANDVSLMDFAVDHSQAQTAAGESKSWGFTIHTPREFRDKLPGDTHLSVFYNRSENFKADAPRGDVFGNKIANPRGQTKDYGVVLSTLNDRLHLKATWFETSVKDATLQADSAGFSDNLYYVWALPYWGATTALAALDGISTPQLRQGNWGWPWNGIAVDSGGNPDPVRIRAIVEDFFRSFPLSQNFVNEYGLGMNVAGMRAATTDAQRYASVPTYGLNSSGAYDPVAGRGAGDGIGLQPAFGGKLRSFGDTPVASVDTLSRGIEFELHAQPTPNWNVTANVSKTKASRTAISPAIEEWIKTYTQFLAGDAGLIKLWGGDPFRTAWANNIIAPYTVLKGQIGSTAPEVPEWRVNIVSNYNFTRSFVKGSNVGIAYRWEDRRILGYRYNELTDTLDNDKPWYGPRDDHVDLWVGYGRQLGRKVGWRIQLNLRNVGEDAHLVPVNRQPDGSIALSRIEEGMTWQLTNTFTF